MERAKGSAWERSVRMRGPHSARDVNKCPMSLGACWQGMALRWSGEVWKGEFLGYGGVDEGKGPKQRRGVQSNLSVLQSELTSQNVFAQQRKSTLPLGQRAHAEPPPCGPGTWAGVFPQGHGPGWGLLRRSLAPPRSGKRFYHTGEQAHHLTPQCAKFPGHLSEQYSLTGRRHTDTYCKKLRGWPTGDTIFKRLGCPLPSERLNCEP